MGSHRPPGGTLGAALRGWLCLVPSCSRKSENQTRVPLSKSKWSLLCQASISGHNLQNFYFLAKRSHRRSSLTTSIRHFKQKEEESYWTEKLAESNSAITHAVEHSWSHADSTVLLLLLWPFTLNTRQSTLSQIYSHLHLRQYPFYHCNHPKQFSLRLF